jgi:NSS family neurotransmitter:Na+ symporter
VSGATPSVHGTWSSRLGFLFATIGFAVGLGDIWRFPWMVGEYGGGAFILVYMICIVGIIIPILIAEFLIGRRARLSPAAAMAMLAKADGRSPAWRWGGIIATVSVFGIGTFYCVVGGWTLAYTWYAIRGDFAGIDVAQSQAIFDALMASPLEMTGWTALFVVVNVAVVARGLNRGVELATSILIPALFVMLVGLAIWGLIVGDARAGLGFLFAADFSKIGWSTWLAAIGQAFFSVGVGMAGLMLYGAYLQKEVRLPGTSVVTALVDSGVGIIACIAIFPFLFAQGLAPTSGPGLVFVVMPVAFQSAGAGAGVLAFTFFLLLIVAALTSFVGMLELVAALGQERGLRRPPLMWGAGAVTLLLSLLTVFSFNIWKDVHPLGFLPGFESRTWFDVIDWLTANIGLTIAALLSCLFAGWVMSAENTADELGLPVTHKGFRAWRWSLRWPVPAAVILLIVAALFGWGG